MKFKGIIFDLDGTLLDTLEDLADSVNAILAGLNLPQHSLDDYRYHVGRGMRSLITNVLPAEMRSDKLLNECVARMFAEYGKRWDAKTRLYEGIDGLLDTLTAHNIPMSIVSNKEHHFTLRVTEKFLGRWKFSAVFGEREGVARKPDPVSLFEAAGIMELKCEDILCLGDSGSDMAAALNAGMYPVGALWGFRDADELLVHGAKVLVKHPVEVAELLTS